MKKRIEKNHILYGVIAVLSLTLISGALLYTNTHKELSATKERLEETRTTLESEVEKLSENLSDTENARDDLRERLEAEAQKIGLFEEQIKDITGTVGVLDKLARTDPELLQKYSKVFFLNEHYTPSELKDIPDELVYNESRDHYIHGKVLPFLEEMVEDAKDDEIDLWVVSAYRSYDEQAVLKGHYTVQFGSGANTFSADQGYSEHQLGTTVDFTTTGLGGGLAGFGSTKAYTWLLDNAHKYGFALSYPEGNQFYVFEPWHWRFVGTELADDLYDSEQFFYDLSQRDIDEYLANFFED